MAVSNLNTNRVPYHFQVNATPPGGGGGSGDGFAIRYALLQEVHKLEAEEMLRGVTIH